MPSLVPSLALVKSGHHSGSGGWSALTANPWFWEVMKHRPVPSWVHGWLTPRLPYFILKVVKPAAKANNWCPRQIPKIGFVLVESTRRRLAIVWAHWAGSPGPLLDEKITQTCATRSYFNNHFTYLMNKPSYSDGFSGWFHGTRSTRAPRDRKQRNWWYFNPQSMAQIRGLPSGL